MSISRCTEPDIKRQDSWEKRWKNRSMDNSEFPPYPLPTLVDVHLSDESVEDACNELIRVPRRLRKVPYTDTDGVTVGQSVFGNAVVYVERPPLHRRILRRLCFRDRLTLIWGALTWDRGEILDALDGREE